jgi:hypothetical protein
MQGFAALLAYVVMILICWLLHLWIHWEPRRTKLRRKKRRRIQPHPSVQEDGLHGFNCKCMSPLPVNAPGNITPEWCARCINSPDNGGDCDKDPNTHNIYECLEIDINAPDGAESEGTHE